MSLQITGAQPRSRRRSRRLAPLDPRVLGPLLVGLLVALVVTGAGARAAPSSQQAPGPGPEAQDADEALPDDSDWLQLQDWVSQLRGLSILRPVPRVELDDADFRAREAELYRAYTDPAELEQTRQLLVGLGLLDPDDDLAELLVDLYSALPIGFYDPLDRVVYTRSTIDPGGPLARVVLAHEFTHALQDQHFGILSLFPHTPANADRDQAVSALLEGDAIIVQEMYDATTQPDSPEAQAAQEEAYQQALQQVYQNIQQTLPIPFEAIPQPVVQQVYSPYLDGPGFIHAVVGTAPLTTFGAYGPAVDPLFRRPPQSTAEILHPDKYLRGWRPQPVDLPDLSDALGEDWHLVRRQVLGELDHRSLLARDLPADDAEQGADGWAGNRALVLADDAGETAAVSETRWDSAEQAAGWGGAFAAAVAARYGDDAALLWAENGRQIWRVPDQAILLEVAGERSLSVQAPTVADAETLADAADEAHARAPLRALTRLLPVP